MIFNVGASASSAVAWRIRPHSVAELAEAPKIRINIDDSSFALARDDVHWALNYLLAAVIT